MRKLEEEVRALIEKNYGSVNAFAKKNGIPTNSVYNALSRGFTNTRTELTDSILRSLKVDWNSVKSEPFTGLKLKDESNDGFVDVPVYGAIAAGTPIDMIPVENKHPVPKAVLDKHPKSFLLRVEGESMNRILPNGCYALIDPCQTAECDGDPYAVCVNGYSATIKRVKKLNNGFKLMPDSNDPTYTSKTYNYNEEGTEEITVIGRVVYYVLPFDWTF